MLSLKLCLQLHTKNFTVKYLEELIISKHSSVTDTHFSILAIIFCQNQNILNIGIQNRVFKIPNTTFKSWMAVPGFHKITIN